jgi:hypothetical protein
MWAKKIFYSPFFFIPWPFQGGHFLGGGIIMAGHNSSALDLKPANLNLRPALQLAAAHNRCDIFGFGFCGSSASEMAT